MSFDLFTIFKRTIIVYLIRLLPEFLGRENGIEVCGTHLALALRVGSLNVGVTSRVYLHLMKFKQWRKR